MPEIRYSRPTLGNVDRGILNSLTISEMEYSMQLAPISIPCSRFVNSCRAAIITSEFFSHKSSTNDIPDNACPFMHLLFDAIAVWIFAYCYPMTFGNSVYFRFIESCCNALIWLVPNLETPEFATE